MRHSYKVITSLGYRIASLLMKNACGSWLDQSLLRLKVIGCRSEQKELHVQSIDLDGDFIPASGS